MTEGDTHQELEALAGFVAAENLSRQDFDTQVIPELEKRLRILTEYDNGQFLDNVLQDLLTKLVLGRISAHELRYLYGIYNASLTSTRTVRNTFSRKTKGNCQSSSR